MTSANEMITDSLGIVLVDEEAISLTENQFALGARFYNDMAEEMELGGLDLNHTPIFGPDDIITTSPAANAGLKFSLAPRLAPSFGVNYIESSEARRAISALRANFMTPLRSRFPSTMPRGSGNIRVFNRERAFYPTSIVFAGLARETSQTVTISAIDTPVLIGSTWIIKALSNFEATEAGRLTFKGARYLSKINISLTIQPGAGDMFTFYIFKNGARMTPGISVLADETRIVALLGGDGTVTDDFFEVFVENNSDTTDLIIDQGVFRIT